jgi:hypothetical protein
MNLNREDRTDWRIELEQFATEELLDWAYEMEFFGGTAFVWDTRHGLDLQKTRLSKIDLSRKGSDELLSSLSQNAGTALPGSWRGGGRRAQDC